MESRKSLSTKYHHLSYEHCALLVSLFCHINHNDHDHSHDHIPFILHDFSSYFYIINFYRQSLYSYPFLFLTLFLPLLFLYSYASFTLILPLLLFSYIPLFSFLIFLVTSFSYSVFPFLFYFPLLSRHFSYSYQISIPTKFPFLPISPKFHIFVSPICCS